MQPLEALTAAYTDAHTHHRHRAAENVWFVRNGWLHPQAGNMAYPVCCGLHPWRVDGNWKQHLEPLRTLLQQPNVVALGECGLDYAANVPRTLQQAAFEAQVALAAEFRKPLVLHLVRAQHELPNFLHGFPEPVVIHGFRGNVQQAEQLLRLDVRLSLGTTLLQQPNRLRELLQVIPNNRLLLETDMQRGQLNTLYTTAAQMRNTNESVFRREVFATFVRTFFAHATT